MKVKQRAESKEMLVLLERYLEIQREAANATRNFCDEGYVLLWPIL